MNNRGISPLIATVLIIGFTVALAALIITWGGQFIRGTQESVEQQTGVQLACSQLSFDITNIKCGDGAGGSGGTKGYPEAVTITSQSNQQIADVILRISNQDGNDVWVSTDRILSSALPAFGSTVIDLLSSRIVNKPNPFTFMNIGTKQVEAIAKIIDSQSGREVACEAGIAKFNIVQLNDEPTGCYCDGDTTDNDC